MKANAPLSTRRGSAAGCKAFLEYDHIDPKALGGTSDAGNLRLMCRMHNRWLAEQTFGRAHVERRIHMRQRMYSSPARVEVKETTADDASPDSENTLDLVERLVNLGFSKIDAKRAMGVIRERRAGSNARSTPSPEDTLREALGILA
jgi:hypothetical protein